jgi:hypothetical protein
LGAEALAQRAAPVFVPRSVARNHNMAALEQLPFAFAQPVQVNSRFAAGATDKKVRGDHHNQGRVEKKI